MLLVEHYGANLIDAKDDVMTSAEQLLPPFDEHESEIQDVSSIIWFDPPLPCKQLTRDSESVATLCKQLTGRGRIWPDGTEYILLPLCAACDDPT